MLTDPWILMRLVVAAVLGALIGFERKSVHKPAGVRTHMLVSLGSALFILVTLTILKDEAPKIIPGIATGIGFLGAGTIFRAKDNVKGLTTAASIWTVAAIGLTVGFGEYILAGISTILVIVILELKKLDFVREV